MALHSTKTLSVENPRLLSVYFLFSPTPRPLCIVIANIPVHYANSQWSCQYFIFTIAGIYFVVGNYNVSNTGRRSGGKREKKLNSMCV